MIPVIGCLPRAGSTLLAALLRQNPSVEVTPTGWLLGQVAAMSQAYNASPARVSWLDQNQARSRFHAALRGACNEYLYSCRQVVVEKGRGWLHWFETVEAAYGGPPRLILPVRDLRGCASSMERAYRRNPEAVGYGGNAPTTAARVSQWLHPAAVPLGRAVAELQDAIQRGVLSRCLVVRYEDLARDPVTELARVYRFLGYEMPPGVHDTENVEEPVREHDAVHGPIGDHVIPPGPVRYNEPDYRDILGDVADAIVRDNQWFYRVLYPEVLEAET